MAPDKAVALRLTAAERDHAEVQLVLFLTTVEALHLRGLAPAVHSDGPWPAAADQRGALPRTDHDDGNDCSNQDQDQQDPLRRGATPKRGACAVFSGISAILTTASTSPAAVAAASSRRATSLP